MTPAASMATAAPKTAAAPLVRALTDDEVAFYREHGWVKVERLIDPDLAVQMRKAVEEPLLADVPGGPQFKNAKIDSYPVWRSWWFPGSDDGIEPIRSVALSPDIGRAAQQLLGRDVGVNFLADNLLVKMPEGREGSAPTEYHQDLVNFPFDRVGFLTFWIALDEVRPEQGALRFYSRSERLGPMGRFNPKTKTRLLDYYPGLVDGCELCEPLHLNPGDATIHSALTVHGAPENATDRPRWALQLGYFPSDTCYTGAPFPVYVWDKATTELTIGEPIRHPQFPVITE